jgi:predicted nucleotidyltransferase
MAIIFGSYAKNRLSAESDIDLLIVGSHTSFPAFLFEYFNILFCLNILTFTSLRYSVNLLMYFFRKIKILKIKTL